MRILHTTAELFPFIKVGGLSDMLSSLSRFQASEHTIHIALPKIQSIAEEIEFTGKSLACIGNDAFGSDASAVLQESTFLEAKRGDILLYFFDSPLFKNLPSIYKNSHEHYNFAVFSYACYYLGLQLDVDIVHSHDWHTALATVLNAIRPEGKGTCFTIHNLSHQGDHPLDLTGFLRIDPFYLKPEHLMNYDKVNYLKGALQHSDEITTVSPGYRNEILSEPTGCFLSWVLNRRVDSLTGILNGIDMEEWNPKTDTHIYSQYDGQTVAEGKYQNKLALYKDYGLHVDIHRPLVGFVGRLAYQKGIKTLLTAFPWKAHLSFYFFILGSGDIELENQLFYHSHHDNQRLYFFRGFSETLARRIEAACDFFIMPSLFEPCGLNQFYSHRYGSIPIVSRVGGLRDSVNESWDIQNFTGLVFESNDESSFSYALDRANSLYYDKQRFAQIRQNIMNLDWSWKTRVGDYLRVYQSAIAKKQQRANTF
ncbi:MAG: glycogen/starch synthase [Spirochaetota bacterium]